MTPWSTGSSIMPQKKNPRYRRTGTRQVRQADRRPGRIPCNPEGFAVRIQTEISKEDKEPVFDAVDTFYFAADNDRNDRYFDL